MPVASWTLRPNEWPASPNNCPKNHPVWGRSSGSLRLGEAGVQRRLQEVTKAAGKIAAQPVPPWDYEAYLEYSRNGVRGNGERMMNARKAGLHVLVLAERSHGRSYLPAISRLLQALSTQPTGTWPAHDKDLRNFRGQRFEVDLLPPTQPANWPKRSTCWATNWTARPDGGAGYRAATRTAPCAPATRPGGKDHLAQGRPQLERGVHQRVTGTALALLPNREDRAVFVGGRGALHPQRSAVSRLTATR